MAAWYGTCQTKDTSSTRAQIIKNEGRLVEYPPTHHAGLLIQYFNECGRCGSGFSGPIPITATELTHWAQGTATVLGCADFQDILDTSAEFTNAVSEFSENDVPAPWQPHMTKDELAKAMEAEERRWDMAMGV